MTLKMFEEGDNLYIEIAGDPSLKKKIKEGLSSLVGKELVEEISGLLPKEEKPKLPDWGEPEKPAKQEEPKTAETKPETEEVTIIADDDDDW